MPSPLSRMCQPLDPNTHLAGDIGPDAVSRGEPSGQILGRLQRRQARPGRVLSQGEDHQAVLCQDTIPSSETACHQKHWCNVPELVTALVNILMRSLQGPEPRQSSGGAGAPAAAAGRKGTPGRVGIGHCATRQWRCSATRHTCAALLLGRAPAADWPAARWPAARHDRRVRSWIIAEPDSR